MVRPRIDLEEQFPLFEELVVLHGKLGDGAVYLRSDADEVGKYFGIVGARVIVGYGLSPAAPVITAAAMMEMLTILPRRGAAHLCRFRASHLLSD